MQKKPTTLRKKATIDQVTTMFAGTQAIIIVSDHQYQWLAGGYDLEIETFLNVAGMAVTWSIVAFCAVLAHMMQH